MPMTPSLLQSRGTSNSITPAPPVCAGIQEGDRLEGCFDIRNEVFEPAPEMMRAFGGKCFVDGVEIRCCCYINTRMGVVWTYDVLKDGEPHTTSRWKDSPPTEAAGFYCAADFPGRHVECPQDDVMRERLTGKVELFAGPNDFGFGPPWQKMLPLRAIKSVEGVRISMADVTHHGCFR